jgi:voltage-gated potassium channel
VNDWKDAEKQKREEEQAELSQRIVDWMELPMVVLGFAWLVLLIIDLVWELPPLLALLSTIIWAIFVVEFLLEFGIAPQKIAYLKHNWLTAIALLVPALRIFRIVRVLRILRVAQTARGLKLVRVLGSLNRGMRALGASLGRHGFSYVAALTVVVTFAGAAGMYAFERYPPGRGLASYPEALWWTAMIMTTLGSDYWPNTAEGRVLCVILSLYAFSVFGFVAASLATFLVGREAELEKGELPSAKSIAALRDEIAGLRDEVRALSERLPKDGA